MNRRIGRAVLTLLIGLGAVGCGGDKCDDFGAMCQSCTSSFDRSLCEGILADLTRNPPTAGVSTSDLCAASMDAFIGTSCRR